MQPTTFATSADGTRLAVYDSGTPGPVVVAVHGYPDNASVWRGVARDLMADTRFVSYDVRGAGASEKPTSRRAYRIDRLVDDLRAVIDILAPEAPVHLVGHDWGSVQSWPAVADARLAGRIASFTSISGPSLDHVAAWVRRSARRQPRLVARQAAHSTYIALFQLPVLPELLIRAGVLPGAATRAERGPGRHHVADPAGNAGATTGVQRSQADFVNGLQLYRANVVGRLARGSSPGPVSVPVRVVLLDADPFLDPTVCAEAPRPWVRDLVTVHLPGGHWAPVRMPDEIARCVRDSIAAA